MNDTPAMNPEKHTNGADVPYQEPMPVGLSYNQRRRWRLGERARWHCKKCQLPAPWKKDAMGRKGSLDHIIPRCKGGTFRRENIQWLCLDCNRKKGDR